MSELAFKTKPFAHQLACHRWLRGRQYAALNGEMGTGKTWNVINDAAALWGEGKLNGLLVVAPNGVHSNWTINELPTHMPDWVRWRAVAWTSNSSKTALRRLNSIFEGDDSSELRILTMNWDALQTVRGLEFAEAFCTSVTKLMIAADESHKMKEFSGKRSKAMQKLRKYTEDGGFRRVMSGTPILNGPFDAFAQFMFLDESILRTTSFMAFKTEYATMLDANDGRVKGIHERLKAASPTGKARAPSIVARNPDGTPQYRNLDKLGRLIDPHTFRVLKADCLDLPEKLYTQTYFELTPKQRAAYDLMREEARIVCESNEEMAVSKLTAIMKLQQILSNFMTSPETGEELVLDPDNNPKIERLRERLQESLDAGHSVIIWARFKRELRHLARVCRELEVPYVSYHGEVSEDDRKLALVEFQAKRARVFVAQQQAGAAGLTLTAATHVIYYSNTFSLGDRLQSEDRAHRIGTKENVLYEDILCAGTVDDKITRALRSKKEIADIVNGDNATGELGL